MVKVRHTLVLCGALLACLPGLLPDARAAEPAPVASFALPAGGLDDALEALARQAHVQLLYDPGLVAGKRSRALRLKTDAASALNQLLEGSGLRAARIDAGTFVLKSAPAVPRPPRNTVVTPRPAATVPVDIGVVQVTGSRIPRSDIDTATTLPLVVIPRKEIEASGKQTLFELLRFQPGMTAHHPIDVSADGVTDAQQPFAVAATTSLNSLGPRATLFLVDGQRVASYGLVSSDLGGLTDLDSIPLSIVDRIEILRGGASAVYGADAMAGVVNIILRKSQQGGEVVARYGISDRGDAGERRVSFGVGHENDRGGGFFVGGEFFDRDELLGADRSWRTLDRRSDGLGDSRYRLGFVNAGFFADRDTSRGPSSRLVEVYCRGAEPSTTPGCLFDPPRGISLQPETRRGSLYVSAHQPLGERTELHADLRVGSVHQSLHYPPMYLRRSLPDDHPDNLLRVNYIDYAFDDLGSVHSRTQADTVDTTLGVRGAFGDWTWNADAGYHLSRVVNRTDGLVRQSALDALIEDYRFVGDNDPAVLAAISPRITARGQSTQKQASFDVGGPWFRLPGGTVQVAAGLEYDHEGLRHRPDALLLSDDVALGERKTAIDASRDNAALYTEVTLPILPRVQADLAARIDYREGYGHHTSPKIGLKWSPVDGLTLRGTRAGGFRAPSLFELRQPAAPQPIDIILAGPLGPCQNSFEDENGQLYCFVERGSIENPDLRPEVSRSDTLGVVWAPSADFSVSVDHYRILRRDEILSVGSGDDPSLFLSSAQRDENGLLVAVYDHYDNVGRTDVRGWQFDTLYHHNSASSGRWTVRLSGDRLQSVRRRARADQPAYDYAGYGAPVYTLLGSGQWEGDVWSAGLDVRRIGSQRVGTPQSGCPTVNLKAAHCRSPGSTTLDANLAWSGWPHWTFSLNVQNLTDRQPVNYDVDKGGYAIAYDDPRGRYYLFSVAYRF
jgi:iron complex outermembrane receptor protein